MEYSPSDGTQLLVEVRCNKKTKIDRKERRKCREG